MMPMLMISLVVNSPATTLLVHLSKTKGNFLLIFLAWDSFWMPEISSLNSFLRY